MYYVIKTPVTKYNSILSTGNNMLSEWTHIGKWNKSPNTDRKVTGMFKGPESIDMTEDGPEVKRKRRINNI